MYRCLAYEDQRFVFAHPYTIQESRLHDSWSGVPIVQHTRTLSTSINAVVQAGLQVEQLIECECNAALAQDDQADPAREVRHDAAGVMRQEA